MAEVLVEIIAGIFSLILIITLAFYLYPKMKQEYKQNGWGWKRYYEVCGDDNRLSYRKWLGRILKK